MTQAVKEVSVQQAREWLDDRRAVMVDVREKEEYEAEHIPGAVLHPASSFNPSKVRELAKGRKIVFQCASGRRAASVCERFIAETGQDNDVYLLEGSLQGWKQAGLPTSSDA